MPVLTSGVDLGPTLEECDYFFRISANGSYIERALAKNTYLVYISQSNSTERRQILVLVTLQYLCGCETPTIVTGTQWQLFFIHRCGF